MNNTPSRTLSTLILSCALLTACGPGKDKKEEPNESSTVTVNGAVVKGVIAGGEVKIYPIKQGKLAEDPMATTLTEADGSYTLALEKSAADTFLVRVTPAKNNTTTMRCDISTGCEGSKFGETVALRHSDLTLDAIYNFKGGSHATVNVSVLTNTAAELALTRLAALSSPDQTAVENTIVNANSSVANRFNVIGDITQLPLIDLTQVDNLDDYDNDSLEYNLYNAAIVEAVMNDQSTMNVESSVDFFARQYVDQNGLADKETIDTANVTVEEVVSSASNILDVIIRKAPANHGLSAVVVELEAAKRDAAMGTEEVIDGLPKQGSLTELGTVKQFVNDFRNLGNSINIDKAEAFTEQIGMASEVFDAESEVLAEALANASLLIVEAKSALEQDPTLTTFALDGIALTAKISQKNDEIYIAIDQSIIIDEQVVKVDLLAIERAWLIEDEISSTANIVESNLNVDIDIELTGSVSTDLVSFDVNAGQLLAKLTSQSLEVGSLGEPLIETSSRLLNVEELRIDIEVSIAERQGDDPISFTGGVLLTIEDLALQENVDRTILNTTSEQKSLVIGRAVVGLSGEFSSASGKRLGASWVANIEGNGIDFYCLNLFDEEQSIAEDCEQETDENYIDGSIAIMFHLDIDGINDDVSVSLTGDRLDRDTLELSLEVSYGGKMMDLTYTGSIENPEDYSLDLVNENGVTVTLVQDTESDEISGIISLNGTQYATISDDVGFPVIRYNDGTNESF